MPSFESVTVCHFQYEDIKPEINISAVAAVLIFLDLVKLSEEF